MLNLSHMPAFWRVFTWVAPSLVLLLGITGSLSQTSTPGEPKTSVIDTLLEESGSGIDIAFVLDTSASMGGAKLASMQNATIEFMQGLSELSGGDVRFAVVPFSQYVNVGLGYRDEPWLSIDVEKDPPLMACRMTIPVVARRNCETVQLTEIRDGRPVSFTDARCESEFGEPRTECQEGPMADAWKGCVGSPAYPDDVEVGAEGSLIPGVSSTTCGAALQPLNADIDVVGPRIADLAAGGETYIAAGLYWGARMLTADQEASETHRRRTIILITDGSNTRSPDYPRHEGTDIRMADERTRELCANIKAAGIEVFTFSMDDPWSNTAVVQRCASGPTHHFKIDGLGGIAAAFGNRKVQDVAQR